MVGFMMKNRLHSGLTVNPNSTLHDGTAEVFIKNLFKHRYSMSVIKDQIIFKINRYLSKITEKWGRLSFSLSLSKNLLNELISTIRVKKQLHSAVVAVLAPWFEDTTLDIRDGYLMRIKNIDTSVLCNYFRIYFYECQYYKVNRIIVDVISDDVIYVRYNSKYRKQRSFVEKLIAECGVCYTHSVLRMIPFEKPAKEYRWLDLFQGTICHILDAHGAAVEESLMLDNDDVGIWVKKAEEMYFSSATGVVVVTLSMKKYFMNKYYDRNINYILYPIFSDNNTKFNGSNNRKSNVLTIVYAGGCQPWQNISYMKEAIESQINLADYYIYITNPSMFIDLWENTDLPENLLVKAGSVQEVNEVYQKAHYGFLLRDENIINQVACPTKLIEYIQSGIIPILKYDDIGDSKCMGLRYLPVEDFIQGKIPTERERFMMSKTNQRILFDRIHKQSGPSEIKNLIQTSIDRY